MSAGNLHSRSGGYNPAFFDRLSAIEDRHFWFSSRNDLIGRFMHRLASDLPAGSRVLEVGCGTGNVLRVLERSCGTGRVIGFDLWAEGLAHVRRRTGCPLVQGDLRRNPFSCRFELVGLFDVLEHIPDDTAVLKTVFDMLPPGGVLLITVPARPSLWSYFDEASRHCRRYSRADLETRLSEAGLRIEFVSEFMMSAYPLVRAGRYLAARARPASADKRVDELAAAELRVLPGVNLVMKFLLKLENRLLARRVRLPLGTSLIAVARRRFPSETAPAAQGSRLTDAPRPASGR